MSGCFMRAHALVFGCLPSLFLLAPGRARSFMAPSKRQRYSLTHGRSRELLFVFAWRMSRVQLWDSASDLGFHPQKKTGNVPVRYLYWTARCRLPFAKTENPCGTFSDLNCSLQMPPWVSQ